MFVVGFAGRICVCLFRLPQVSWRGFWSGLDPASRGPQFRNFSTYVLGLVVCDGKRNVETINRCFVEARDQSSLNRFLTASPWSPRRLNRQRLALVRESLHFSEGAIGFLLLDDTILEKTSLHMEGAGYHYSNVKGRTVWGHILVTTHYTNGDVGYPVDLDPLPEEGDMPEVQDQDPAGLRPSESLHASKGHGDVVMFDSW